MAYSVKSRKSGKTYFLHRREQKLRNQPEPVALYYFGQQVKESAIDAIPEGYEVTEHPRTGLPLLRKVRSQKTEG